MHQCSHCMTMYGDPEPTINFDDLSRSWNPDDFRCPCCDRFPKSKRKDKCYICNGKMKVESAKILHNVILAVNPQTIVETVECCNKDSRHRSVARTDISYCVYPYNWIKKDALKCLSIEDRMFLTEREVESVFESVEWNAKFFQSMKKV